MPGRMSAPAKRRAGKRGAIASQQAELLLCVRARDGLSRIDLARGLNLAPSTVGIYVDHLVGAGYLYEGKAAEREFGRPPTILALNPQGGRFIGVDFEARNIMAVAVDFSQRPLKQVHDTITASEPVDRILAKIEHAIETAREGNDPKLLAIGVGVPGVVDPARGLGVSYKHIEGWENVPLVERLADRFGVPVFAENNIRTMALAELWFGQGRGLRNFICLGMRTGLGAGMIIDGQVYRGAENRAGEIGDWPCAPVLAPGEQQGSVAKPFTRLEEITSLQSLRSGLPGAGLPAAGARESAQAEPPLEALVRAASAGDPAVVDFLERTAQTLGLVLNQLNCVFGPEKIILAGALTAFGDVFLGRLQAALRRFGPPTGAPLVVCSQLGSFNGAIGAAALAVHRWRPVAR